MIPRFRDSAFVGTNAFGLGRVQTPASGTFQCPHDYLGFALDDLQQGLCGTCGGALTLLPFPQRRSADTECDWQALEDEAVPCMLNAAQGAGIALP